MEPNADDMLGLLDDEYIGDDLTVEDLRSGYSAFVEDQASEGHTDAAPLEAL